MTPAICYNQEVAAYSSYFSWVEGTLLMEGLHICRAEGQCTYVEAEDVDQRRGMQGFASSKAASTNWDGLVGCVICTAEKAQQLKQHPYTLLRLPLHLGQEGADAWLEVERCIVEVSGDFHTSYQASVFRIARSCPNSGTSSMMPCLYTRYKAWTSYGKMLYFCLCETLYNGCKRIYTCCLPSSPLNGLFNNIQAPIVHTLLPNKERRIVYGYAS